ncbi:hypothetical protein OGATHE_002356, partial [Ogataea polymorpha]
IEAAHQEATTIEIKVDASRAIAAEKVAANIDHLLKKEQELDWRTLQRNVCFTTAKLDTLIQRLEAASVPFQTRPDKLNAYEVYVVDPLGAVVGFTDVANTIGTSQY